MAPSSWPLLSLCTNRCWSWWMQWSPWITIPFKTAQPVRTSPLGSQALHPLKFKVLTYSSCLWPDFWHKHFAFLALFVQELCKGLHFDLKLSLATHIEVAKRVIYFTWDNCRTSISLGTNSCKHLKWEATNHLRSQALFLVPPPKYEKWCNQGSILWASCSCTPACIASST